MKSGYIIYNMLIVSKSTEVRKEEIKYLSYRQIMRWPRDLSIRTIKHIKSN